MRLLFPFHRHSTPWQWGALMGLTVLAVAALEAVHLPAALLLGAMAAAIAVAVGGASVSMPPVPFILAQGFVGCLIARSVPVTILAEMAKDWPLFVAVVAGVIAAACGLGWLLARWQVLPGSSAVWGAFPGAASAMALMAEAFGADMRLVAFMQYLRVVFVAVTASLVARFWGVGSGAASHMAAVVWFGPVAWLPLLETIVLAVAGALIASRLRVPAGPLLVPMLIGIVLQDSGLMTITLPPWLLAVAYACLGWAIGLRFTPSILHHVARALLRVSLSILSLIVICGGFAFLLAHFAHIDPLTAYLATSPGGADSVAIIAASTPVDVPFVMALQTARFIVVLLAGPMLARFIATHSGVRDEMQMQERAKIQDGA